MNNNLNAFEQAIINEIIKSNEREYPVIIHHLPYLIVKSRQLSGVGMYIHFGYSSEEKLLPITDRQNIALSSNKSLELDELNYGLNYELVITKGKIDFLELVTNGESWNGRFNGFKLVK